MREELDKKLVEKYPKIFADRQGNMLETAMCWGFDHGDGWYWLLDQLCSAIQSHIDSNNKFRSEQIIQVVATQVKEKWGTLNFYYYGGDEAFSSQTSMITFQEFFTNKLNRVSKYREMANYPEISLALDAVCDEAIAKNSNGDMIQ